MNGDKRLINLILAAYLILEITVIIYLAYWIALGY